MGMPQLVVTAVLVEGRTKSEVAREYGVSRRWVITLVQRYLAEGDAGLRPRPRRPLRSPNRTAKDIEDEVIALRKELERDGHEAGAATIAFHLQRRHEVSPAVSTIWRILSARGFVIPQPHKRPKSSYIRFAAEQPNERWQLDITHCQLAERSDVEILNILDDHSRLCLGSDTLPVFKARDVNNSFGKAVAAYGNPASLLSDNGAVFTGRYRGTGRVALEVTLHARGISFGHCRPYHPQTCGKVERFHQTLKKWLIRQIPAQTVIELQTQLDTFRAYYNTVRPHRALGRRTPQQAYLARPKATPTGTPTTRWRLPHPPRPHRQQRQAHRAPQQPPTPHRHGPPLRRHQRLDPHPRPTHPSHDHRWPTTARTSPRPDQGLPTTSKTVNDVPRHMCTMSRDIARARPKGFEPPTF
jgi:transposase InsO family protein